MIEANCLSGYKICDLNKVVWFQEGPGVRKNQFRTFGVKLLNVGNICDRELILDKTNIYISEEEAYGKYKHFLVDEDDLLIASSGIKVEYFDKKITFAKKEHLPLCMNTSTIRFKVLDKNVLDINYFRHFLASRYFTKQVQFHITGSAQLNFGPSHLNKMKIMVPSIEKQKKIAQILDKADEIRQKKKLTNDKLDEFLKSTFIDMFGDPGKNPKEYLFYTINDITTEISDIGSNGSNATVASNLVMSDTEDYAYMIRTLNFNDTNLMNNMKYVSKKVYDFFKKSQIFGNEIIMCKIGSAGKFWIMPKLDKPVSLGLNQFFMRFNDKVLREFVYYYLCTGFGQNEINNRISGAVTKSITKGAIRTIPIFLPPLNEQKQFAQIVEKVEAQKQRNELVIEQMNNLFNSLSQGIFNKNI